MAAIDINVSSTMCRKCGKAYGRLKGNFPVNYGPLYKGNGYIPYCRSCIDQMYEDYYSESKSELFAVRQVCRKLDLYWNQSIFNSVMKRNSQRSMMTSYMAAINNVKYAGKCYDDTLREYGALWSFGISSTPPVQVEQAAPSADNEENDCEAPSDEIKNFWGPGYSDSMYWQLNERYKYWLDQYPEDVELTIGEEALLRQVCNLEISIAQSRSQNKSIEKEVNTLNSIIGSLNIRPDKKKAVEGSLDESTPFGVWIRRIEDTRPVAEPDPQFRDVDGIRKYITVWFFGHLCKMLKIKNSYSRLYEDEMAKLRVERPEYEGEDDDAIIEDIFARADSDENEQVGTDERT